jgi:hypothetical protein
LTVVELGERLRREGYRSDVYSLDGSLPTFEGLVLKQQAGQWTIEHCERGVCRELEVLGSEDSACDRMYTLLSNYFHW